MVKKCSVCGKPSFLGKFFLYMPSNVAYFYCKTHMRIALTKPPSTPIKEFWESQENKENGTQDNN